ncbi:MAG: cytochrome b/b6 domain-containing protein [Pseudomonadota bacterium]
MTRYHPLLVALHWVMALMIGLALAAGSLLLDALPNDDPQKVEGLAGHMTIGLSIGVLLIVRLLTRSLAAAPPHASTGNALLDRIGVGTHWAFYLLIAGMVLSGLGIALSTGLFPIVFGGEDGRLPDSIDTVAPRAVHGLLATLLMSLITLHVLAAIYHMVVLKDGLLRRMWFGRRT